MNRDQSTGIVILLSLFLLVGFSSAAESYEYLAVLQGGESTIVNDTEDMKVITVHNPEPYLNITNNTSSTQNPVYSFMNASFPMNAVAIFSAPDTEMASMIRIEGLSISDNKSYLTLQVRSLDMYDGEVLTPYVQGTGNLHELDTKTFNETRLYLEVINKAPDNFFPADDPFPSKSPCERCLSLCLPIVCKGSSTCQVECDVFC